MICLRKKKYFRESDELVHGTRDIEQFLVFTVTTALGFLFTLLFYQRRCSSFPILTCDTECCRFVCSDIPELQMAMEMNVLNGHNTKR